MQCSVLSLSVYTTISKIRTTELLVTTTGIEATEHLRISGWVEGIEPVVEN